MGPLAEPESRSTSATLPFVSNGYVEAKRAKLTDSMAP